MKTYVRDLEPNQLCRTTFLVNAKEVRQKKTGEPFLSLSLGDKTGDIDAKMWDNVTDVVDSFGAGDFVKVKGVMSLYNGRPQFTVHTLDRLEDFEVEMGDFFATSSRDPQQMLEELQGIIAGVTNAHLRALLEAFFADEDLRDRYMRAPAAKQIHHAYLGGLLEHVLSLCTLCKLVAPHYSTVDPDLLITGAILHDIGKVEELTYDRGLGYSSSGQLLGHISIGVRYLHDKLRQVPGFPAPLAVLVEHMILSHHGKLEFGSPKVPMIAEALLLHYLDDMDSKMEALRAQLERDEKSDGLFTAYNYALERSALKRDRFLAGGGQNVASHEPAASVAATPKPEPRGTSLAPSAANAQPARSQSGSRADRTPAQRGSSLFGDKLLGALGEES
ncbi:MAG: HD domain-containing protein [Bryobacterales bacterium]|nr:HD domain-containing protein [Bryobacterales bacterium]